jgi:hypothetical protein
MTQCSPSWKAVLGAVGEQKRAAGHGFKRPGDHDGGVVAGQGDVNLDLAEVAGQQLCPLAVALAAKVACTDAAGAEVDLGDQR